MLQSRQLLYSDLFLMANQWVQYLPLLQDDYLLLSKRLFQATFLRNDSEQNNLLGLMTVYRYSHFQAMMEIAAWCKNVANKQRENTPSKFQNGYR
jgi:hypothetical protein